MHSSLYHNLLQAKQNNPVAFKIILDHFLPQIHSYGRKTGSEDTAQSLILFLLELIRKLPEEKDYFHDSEIPLLPDFALTDPKKFEISVWLLDLLKTLKASERRILTMIYFYGYSVKEIAAAEKVSVQAVNQRKNRALDKIRQQLKSA